MGQVDQGVFTLWVLSHLLGRPLRYIGYGGGGKQVRDLLHVRDLFELLVLELPRMDELSGSVFNVGGGRSVSLSLLETTRLCADITGRSVPTESVTENRFADVPIYLTDTAKVAARTGWAPRTSAAKIIEEIDAWARDRLPVLEAALS
jgi:CDP-paratose 2-epimerase